MACSRCRCAPTLPGDPPIPVYCDTTCQKGDLQSHKPKCDQLSDRTTLYRVTSLAQKLFYVHREFTWCTDIQGVEKFGSNVFYRGEVRYSDGNGSLVNQDSAIADRAYSLGEI